MTGVLSLAAAVLTRGAVLAEDTNNFGDTRGGAVAGPLGLFLVVALGIATWLLVRNMGKRLRRLPTEFPDQRRDRIRGPDPARDDEPTGQPDR